MLALTPAALRLPARRVLRSGLLGALAAPHGVDSYVEFVRGARSLGDPPAEIVAVDRRSIDGITLTLRPSLGWRGFRAGQFIRLTVEIAGVRETRCYSPACSEQAEGQIEITVKTHPAGKVSRHLHEHAHPGMAVGLSEAAGEFVLPRERPERLLLISGGSGITPVMSMLRTLRDEGHTEPVTFLHYARARRHLPYREELRLIAASAPNVRVALAFTREAGTLRGHLSRAHLRRVAPGYASAHTYVCGPPSLLAAARALWAREGGEQRLHIESFQPPTPPTLANRAAGGTSRAASATYFACSDRRVRNDGCCLLEQAERAGLRPQFGCRMGICRICTARKTTGSVRNLLTGEISKATEEDIQICVSAPVGDVELAI